uniref:Smad anchor for receptor activation-like Smad-binding domain-containing protein n=1 Tax=Oryzias latipes TaxID=8090 RepID=A0A3B3HUN4_ORYLA
MSDDEKRIFQRFCCLLFECCLFLSPSAQSWETPTPASNQSPNPNNPAEYCSTIPPLQQAQASGVLSSPPPTVMVPVGVLKQPSNEGTAFVRQFFSAPCSLC